MAKAIVDERQRGGRQEQMATMETRAKDGRNSRRTNKIAKGHDDGKQQY